MLKFDVNYDTNQGTLTVKDYVRHHLKFSLTAWRKLKYYGTIELNGQLAFPHTLVFTSDQLILDFPSTSHLVPIAGSLSVCYEDEHLLAVNKPSGLLVHPTSKLQETTLAHIVLNYYESRGEKNGFHPIHRLDRNTSGLLLIAKQPYLQQLLSSDSLKPISRQYLALAEGRFIDSGIITAPIGRKPGSIIERIVAETGQSASTAYEIVKVYPSACFLRLTLSTGRTHQIRVHLSHIGHPLLGDDLYGGNKRLISRQALHSAVLSFFHPLLKKSIILKSPIPSDMLQAITKLQANNES